MATDYTKIAGEIQTAAFKAAQDEVKAQIARGLPNKGMSGARHTATIAAVVTEIASAYAKPDDDPIVVADPDYNRKVMEWALAGSLLNASALRQDLEGRNKNEVILIKETPLANQYGVTG